MQSNVIPQQLRKENMVLSEFLDALRDEGLPATNYRIHYAISAGYIPRPARDRSGRYVFLVADLRAARRYLKNLPKPGRRKQVSEITKDC